MSSCVSDVCHKKLVVKINKAFNKYGPVHHKNIPKGFASKQFTLQNEIFSGSGVPLVVMGTRRILVWNVLNLNYMCKNREDI